MIAIAIFGMIVATIYSVWSLILRSSTLGRDVAAQIQRERITVRTIEDSLTCVQSFQASMKYYSFIVQNGNQPMLSFAARLPAMFPRDGRFGDFNLRRLTFTVEPGADGESDLVLRQNPILMPVDPDEQAYPLVLARNVKDFAVECWDTNQMQWVDEWDDTNSIPPMVLVSLTMGGNSTGAGGGQGLTFTRVIALPSMTMPAYVQAAPGGGPGGLGGINFQTPGGGGQPPPQFSNPNSPFPPGP